MHGKWGGASRVKSKRRPNKRRCRETKTSTQRPLLSLPGQALRVNVVGVVAVGGENKESVEGEKEEEKTKEKEDSRWLEGQLGKVVVISFLGKSPDSCSVNARPLSSSKTEETRGGEHRSVLKFASLTSSKGREEVQAATSGGFYGFF